MHGSAVFDRRIGTHHFGIDGDKMIRCEVEANRGHIADVQCKAAFLGSLKLHSPLGNIENLNSVKLGLIDHGIHTEAGAKNHPFIVAPFLFDDLLANAGEIDYSFIGEISTHEKLPFSGLKYNSAEKEKGLRIQPSTR